MKSKVTVVLQFLLQFNKFTSYLIVRHEPDIVEKIKGRTLKPLNINVKDCVLCDYEKVNDYVLVTIPSISLKEQLQIYPIVFAKKKNVLITRGEEDGHSHSKLIKLMIGRLRELVEYGENLNSSFSNWYIAS